MSRNRLETCFSNTAKRESGSCPLPEPGRGAPQIEEPSHLRIKRQPKDYDYDASVESIEARRFLQDLESMLRRGDLTQEQYDAFLRNYLG